MDPESVRFLFGEAVRALERQERIIAKGVGTTVDLLRLASAAVAAFMVVVGLVASRGLALAPPTYVLIVAGLGAVTVGMVHYVYILASRQFLDGLIMAPDLAGLQEIARVGNHSVVQLQTAIMDAAPDWILANDGMQQVLARTRGRGTWWFSSGSLMMLGGIAYILRGPIHA